MGLGNGLRDGAEKTEERAVLRMLGRVLGELSYVYMSRAD